MYVLPSQQCTRKADKQALFSFSQAGLVYRAIKLHIRLFNWDRALDLAQKHKQHVDTVLYHRARYLTAAKQQEHNTRFLQLAREVPINEADIRERKKQDKAAEAARPGARRYL